MLTFAIGMSAVSATALIVAGATGLGGLPGVLAPMMLVLAAAGLAMPNTPALALTRHGEAAGTASALLGFSQFGVGSGRGAAGRPLRRHQRGADGRDDARW